MSEPTPEDTTAAPNPQSNLPTGAVFTEVPHDEDPTTQPASDGQSEPVAPMTPARPVAATPPPPPPVPKAVNTPHTSQGPGLVISIVTLVFLVLVFLGYMAVNSTK